MSFLSPITPPVSLTTRALAALRQDILTTRLAPGETLSEATTAERLKLGKAPIRAALARLAEEGLVQPVPRRGWVVSLVTVRDIHEVFDLRLLLEPEAARRAAALADVRAAALADGRVAVPAPGRIDAAALDRLDAVCKAGYRPEDTASALGFLEANRAFHVAIAALSGNARLARQIGRLLDESTRMLVLGLRRRDRSGEMANEHRALTAALAAGDAAGAAALMRDQVAASRAMVLAALTAPDAATGV